MVVPMKDTNTFPLLYLPVLIIAHYPTLEGTKCVCMVGCKWGKDTSVFRTSEAFADARRVKKLGGLNRELM